MGLLNWLFGRKNRIALQPETSVVVAFNAERILCTKPQSKDESISWSKLDAVLIETNDKGPLEPDVFWLLITKDMSSGCVIPQGATGEKELLKEMQTRLPDFDNEMLIKAIGSTSNQKFLIWERKKV